MKRKGMRIAVLLLVIVVMTLWFTGCKMSVNKGLSGLSDVSYADSEKYLVGEAELSETVEHIEIHWLVGNVTVKPHSADTVSFSEESPAALTNDMQVHYWLDGMTLHIQFCQSGKWRLDEMEKDLTVMIPEKLNLNSLVVKSLSANIYLDTIQAESAAINTSSGNAELTNCTVTDIVQIDTISGWLNAQFSQPLEIFTWNATSGTLQITAPEVKNFSASSVSGAVSLSAEKEPEILNIQTTSGNIDFALPENASFSLDYDSTSGELSSDLPHRTESGQHIFGDGKAEYIISSVSGDVQIKQAIGKR